MLGAHLSISGGYHNALLEAERMGMETVQIFTKNQRQWNAPPIDPEWVASWKREAQRLGWKRFTSHASYLINLASPDEVIYRKSVDAMVDEVERCEALGIPYLVVHPGSHKGAGEEAGIANIVAAIDEVIRRTAGGQSIILLETTVGGGNQIGGRFEHLAMIRERVAAPERVGACLDTCHICAAGYDISTRAATAAVFDEFDSIVGLDRLFTIHMNDSMFSRGSRRDRHAHIHDGHIGREAFAFIVNDPRFATTPKILETEKGETEKGTSWDVVNLRRLRRLISGPNGASSKSPPAATRRAPRNRKTSAPAAAKAAPAADRKGRKRAGGASTPVSSAGRSRSRRRPA